MIGSKYDEPTIGELLSSYSEVDQMRLVEIAFRAMVQKVSNEYGNSGCEVRGQLPPTPHSFYVESRINNETVNNINTMSKISITFKDLSNKIHHITCDSYDVFENCIQANYDIPEYTKIDVINLFREITHGIKFYDGGYSILIPGDDVQSIIIDYGK